MCVSFVEASTGLSFLYTVGSTDAVVSLAGSVSLVGKYDQLRRQEVLPMVRVNLFFRVLVLRRRGSPSSMTLCWRRSRCMLEDAEAVYCVTGL